MYKGKIRKKEREGGREGNVICTKVIISLERPNGLNGLIL